MARALLLVPPFIKYSSGPMLGPALLQSAARLAGHECSVVDLNAHYIQPRVAKRGKLGVFVGDHDKPRGDNSLSSIENDFVEDYIIPAIQNFQGVDCNGIQRRIKFGFFAHEQVSMAATHLACSSFGSWVGETLQAQRMTNHPDAIGVSLLHAGQVIPAVAVSIVAKTLWPSAIVVWGGPHISGLGRVALEKDLKHRSFAADAFVTGHAEQTFVQILDDIQHGKWNQSKNDPIVLNGVRGAQTVSPTFGNLCLYDSPLTLPAQSALGCSYGRCAFCTYPAIEPTPTKLRLFEAVGAVVDKANELGGSVSIKDSLATCTRLIEIGNVIDNKVPWSACTKLSRRLDLETLNRLSSNGLATLEVGLESLLPSTQKRIGKIQSEALFEKFVSDMATTKDLTLVVNYMVGFPWEDPEEAMAKLDQAQRILDRYLGRERARIELNEFELERLAPMARFPELYGIDQVKSWPWASVMEYSCLLDEERDAVCRLSSSSRANNGGRGGRK